MAVLAQTHADYGASDIQASGVAPQADQLTTGLYGGALQTGGDGSRYNSTAEMIKGRMPDLVKGAGLAHKGGNMPLSNHSQIMTKAAQASMDIRLETARGFGAKSQVVGSLNQGWLNSFGALKTALTMPSLGEELAAVLSYMPGGPEALQKFAEARAYNALASAGLGKSFTAGNIGIGSIYGLTPFNLLAPSRLIYPVYTVI